MNQWTKTGRAGRAPRLAVAAALGLATVLVGSSSRGDEQDEREKAARERAEKDQRERRRAQLLDQMRERAEQTKVAFKESRGEAKLVRTPAFRYSDQPRRFIDATLWAWTLGGRPVAFQKIEAMDFGEPESPNRLWQFCFASLSADSLTVQWPEGRRFQSTEPGLDFQALAGAPPVAAESAQRKRQARELVRKFSARIVTDPKDNTTQEMRLLTTPLLEFEDPKTKELQGTVFGLSTNGTNPDVLIVLEVRGDGEKRGWHFAPARMTSGAVTLTYRDSKVWETKWVDPGEAPFPTWTYFATAREVVAEE